MAVCVLLVEDEWVTLMALAVALEAEGHEVMTAEHGGRAFVHLDDHPGLFTCLVTDFHMPGGITGAHVVQRMRPDYPAIPMIITTALPQVVTSEWRLQYDVHLLPKPYSMQSLVQMVSRFLSP